MAQQYKEMADRKGQEAKSPDEYVGMHLADLIEEQDRAIESLGKRIETALKGGSDLLRILRTPKPEDN